MKATRVLVTGAVQGVGFRDHTRRAALALGLHGYVRNLPDGRVEAVATGPEDQLMRFLAEVWRGPRGSRVDDVDTMDAELEDNLKAFLIRA